MLTDVRVSEQRCDQVVARAQTDCVQVEQVGQHCLARAPQPPGLSQHCSTGQRDHTAAQCMYRGAQCNADWLQQSNMLLVMAGCMCALYASYMHLHCVLASA